MARLDQVLLAVFVAAAAATPANVSADAKEVRTTPEPYKWVPDRPPPEETTCLHQHRGGCTSILDQAGCLSSRDGSKVVEDGGLRIHGEPCVWCGGAHCHTDTVNLCVPYDYLANGKGSAFADFSAEAQYAVAHCTVRNSIPQEDRQCLQWQPLGCNTLKDGKACLASRDGRQIAELDGFSVGGQPCVWCGGACTSKDTSVCQPYDWVVHGQGRAFATFHAQAVYRVASCLDGHPADVRPWYVPATQPLPRLVLATPAPYWRPPHPAEATMQCLGFQVAGCSLIRDADVCLGSRDGRQATTHNAGLQLYGEPCVWCGGGVCTSSSKSLCEPFNYLMYGETEDPTHPKEFDTFHAKGYFSTATCRDGEPIPAEERTWGGARPLWVPPAFPTNAEIQCLHRHADGCSAIADMGRCMDSLDGRMRQTDEHGFQIYEQPCVWCGGGPCVTNSSSLCEAFDYVMHGEGVAFHSFLGKAVYTVATCKARPDETPLVQQTEELTCLVSNASGCASIEDEQSCLRSRDGTGLRFFAGLRIHGQACVWCGGVACTSSSNSTCGPYDYVANGEGRAFAAANSRPSWRVGVCHGANREVVALPTWEAAVDDTTLRPKWEELARPLLAVRYGQCGGQSWDGPTRCEPGMACKFKTEAFWQCLPGAPGEPALLHPGEDCMPACGRGGVCQWCGATGACCRGGGWPGDPPECFGSVANATWHHQCVRAGLSTAATIPAGGRFITDGKRTYWQDPAKLQKHPVPESVDCAICGCKDNVVLLTPDRFDDLQTGEDFNCSIVAPFMSAEAADSHPLVGRFVTTGKRVWWQEPGGQVKHLVPPDGDCDACGCRGEAVSISERDLDAMAEGDAFRCDVTPSPPALGAAVPVAPGPAGAETAADATRGDATSSFGAPWLCGVAILLVASAGGAALLAHHVGLCGSAGGEAAKRKRGTRAVGALDKADSYPEAAEGGVEAPLIAASAAAKPQVLLPAFATSAWTAAAPQAPMGMVGGPFSQLPRAAPPVQYRTVTFTGHNVQSKAQAFMGLAPDASPQHPPLAGFAASPPAIPAAAPRRVPMEPVATSGLAGFPLGVRMEPIARSSPPPPLSAFDAIDRNHDGQISREEWRQYAFDAIDSNHDGVISQREWGEARRGR